MIMKKALKFKKSVFILFSFALSTCFLITITCKNLYHSSTKQIGTSGQRSELQSVVSLEKTMLLIQNNFMDVIPSGDALSTELFKLKDDENSKSVIEHIASNLIPSMLHICKTFNGYELYQYCIDTRSIDDIIKNTNTSSILQFPKIMIKKDKYLILQYLSNIAVLLNTESDPTFAQERANYASSSSLMKRKADFPNEIDETAYIDRSLLNIVIKDLKALNTSQLADPSLNVQALRQKVFNCFLDLHQTTNVPTHNQIKNPELIHDWIHGTIKKDSSTPTTKHPNAFWGHRLRSQTGIYIITSGDFITAICPGLSSHIEQAAENVATVMFKGNQRISLKDKCQSKLPVLTAIHQNISRIVNELELVLIGKFIYPNGNPSSYLILYLNEKDSPDIDKSVVPLTLVESTDDLLLSTYLPVIKMYLDRNAQDLDKNGWNKSMGLFYGQLYVEDIIKPYQIISENEFFTVNLVTPNTPASRVNNLTTIQGSLFDINTGNLTGFYFSFEQLNSENQVHFVPTAKIRSQLNQAVMWASDDEPVKSWLQEMLSLQKRTGDGGDIDSSTMGLNPDLPCPSVFNPICAKLEEQSITFHNRCLMEKKRAVFIHNGFCSKQRDSDPKGEAQDPKKSTDSPKSSKGIDRATRPSKFRLRTLPKKERKDPGGCTIKNPLNYH